MRTVTIAAVLLGVAGGCGQATEVPDLGSKAKALVVREILERTAAWAEAIRRKDTAAVLDLFLDSEDLRHAENGVIFSSHAALAEFVTGWYDSTVSMDFSWEQRDVVALSADAATMTGLFRFEATQESGEVWSGRNVFTGVFLKRGGQWGLVHGHESTVPPPEPDAASPDV